jgi:hypothetical protein
LQFLKTSALTLFNALLLVFVLVPMCWFRKLGAQPVPVRRNVK